MPTKLVLFYFYIDRIKTIFREFIWQRKYYFNARQRFALPAVWDYLKYVSHCTNIIKSY